MTACSPCYPSFLMKLTRLCLILILREKKWIFMGKLDLKLVIRISDENTIGASRMLIHKARLNLLWPWGCVTIVKSFFLLRSFHFIFQYLWVDWKSKSKMHLVHLDVWHWPDLRWLTTFLRSQLNFHHSPHKWCTDCPTVWMSYSALSQDVHRKI